jgi:hypothetical protein
MARGSWGIVEVPTDGPIQYDHGVQYTSIFGDDAMLMANGTPMTFTKEDAETIAVILNKQIEEVTEWCIDELAKGYEQ